MPLQKLLFKPGINRETTNYANEGGYYSGDKIRFRAGSPEKIGGWQNLSFGYTYKGVCRQMWNWIALDGANLNALGTNQKFYVENGGNYNDCTPLAAPAAAAANAFSTTSGSRLVTVTDTSHGATSGTYVTFAGAADTGGILAATLNAEFEIITAIDGNTYTIISPTTATSTVTAGGGAGVTAAYDISAGGSIYTVGVGWGAGSWPSYSTTSLTNPFTAAGTGISVLKVAHTAHGLTTGDYVYFFSIASLPCTITKGGVAPNVSVLQKSFSVTVTGANEYTISIVIGSDTYITNSTGASGGAVTVFIPATPVRAWSSAAAVGVGVQLRLWTIDNFGQDLVMAPRNGALYYWAKNTSTYPRAITLAAAATAALYDGTYVPSQTLQILTSGIQRFGLCFGANPYDPTTPSTTFDPMLVRWSDQENIYDWVPTTFNQSGEQRLSNGSSIVTAVNSRQEIIVFTDTAIFVMQYLGPPYVWGFQLITDNISIASPKAVTSANNVTYWMGADKFYTYAGRVDTLDCTIWKYIYNNINKDQLYQIVSGTNAQYNEVWWFYPSANSQINDSYAIYNYLEKIWYYGSLNRTAWLDSALRQNPMAAFGVQVTYLAAALTASDTSIQLIDSSTYPTTGSIQIDSEVISYTGNASNILTGCTRGLLNTTATTHVQYTVAPLYIPNQVMFHELGVDDGSLSVSTAIAANIQTSDFDIGDGHNFGFVWRMLPDVTFDGSNVNAPSLFLTLKPRVNSGTAYGEPSPNTVLSADNFVGNTTYTIETYTGQVYTRLRGRQMSFKISSTALGVAWQLGATRLDIRPDGRR